MVSLGRSRDRTSSLAANLDKPQPCDRFFNSIFGCWLLVNTAIETKDKGQMTKDKEQKKDMAAATSRK